MGSNPTRGTDVCVVLCVGSDLATDRSPVQRVITHVYRITKLKKRPGSNKGQGCTATDEWMNTSLNVYEFPGSTSIKGNERMKLQTNWVKAI
jgi:hypothetical protein